MLFRNSFAAAGVAARRSIPFWITAFVMSLTGSWPDASTILLRISLRERLRLGPSFWNAVEV
jgi:hypothetical protein